MITKMQNVLYKQLLKSNIYNRNKYRGKILGCDLNLIKYFNTQDQGKIVTSNDSVNENIDNNIKSKANNILQNHLLKIIRKYNEMGSGEFIIFEQDINIIILELQQITVTTNQNVCFELSNDINCSIDIKVLNQQNYQLELLIKPEIYHNDLNNIAVGRYKTIKLHSLLIVFNENLQIISSAPVVTVAQQQYENSDYYMNAVLYKYVEKDGFRLFNKANKIQYINLNNPNMLSIKINRTLIVSYLSKYYFINTHQLIKDIFTIIDVGANINEFLPNFNSINLEIGNLFDSQEIVYYEDMRIEDFCIQLKIHKNILINHIHNRMQDHIQDSKILQNMQELELKENNILQERIKISNPSTALILSFNDIKQSFKNYNIIKIESTKIFIKDNLGVSLEFYLKQNKYKIKNNIELFKLLIVQVLQTAKDLSKSVKFIFDIKLNNMLLKDNIDEIIAFHRERLFSQHQITLPPNNKSIEKTKLIENAIYDFIKNYEFFNQEQFEQLGDKITIKELLSSMNSHTPLKIKISIIDYSTEIFTYTTESHHKNITKNSGLFEFARIKNSEKYDNIVAKQEILCLAIVFYKIYCVYQPQNIGRLQYTLFNEPIETYEKILKNNDYPRDKFYLLVKSAFEEKFLNLDLFFETLQTIIDGYKSEQINNTGEW